MRLEIEVELADAPGQLIGVLETVGRFGGNIVTVVHDRSRLRNGRVPVLLALDAPQEGEGRMLEALRADFRVLRVQGARNAHLGAFLLIGHVIQNDLAQITEAVFQSGAEVRRVRVDVASRDAPSAVMVDVVSVTEESMKKALRKVRELSRGRDYVFVDALGASA